MLEPGLVEAAHLSPGQCFICGGNEGPMVDTRVDIAGDGRFYICTRLCLPMIGRCAGYLDPQTAGQIAEASEAVVARVAELEAELEREKASKVVSLDDALAIFEKRLAVAGKAPKAKAAAA